MILLIAAHAAGLCVERLPPRQRHGGSARSRVITTLDSRYFRRIMRRLYFISRHSHYRRMARARGSVIFCRNLITSCSIKLRRAMPASLLAIGYRRDARLMISASRWRFIALITGAGRRAGTINDDRRRRPLRLILRHDLRFCLRYARRSLGRPFPRFTATAAGARRATGRFGPSRG